MPLNGAPRVRGSALECLAVVLVGVVNERNVYVVQAKPSQTLIGIGIGIGGQRSAGCGVLAKVSTYRRRPRARHRWSRLPR